MQMVILYLENNNSLFGNNNNFSLFGQKSNTNQNNANTLFSQSNTSTNQTLFNNNAVNTNNNQSSSLFGSLNNGSSTTTTLFQGNNIQQTINIQNNNIFSNSNTTNSTQINYNDSLTLKKKKSLGEILLNKIQENKESQNLSYNSEYIQEKLDQEEQKNINKYKNTSFEISSANNININPVFKNDIMSIKDYFNKSGNKFKLSRLKANSFDMSFNLESKVLTNLENSFSKKLSMNTSSNLKNNKKKIVIRCQITEPHKASFTVLVGKKVEISKLKKTIAEQLSKKHKVYSSLKPSSFCLMKNYSFITEYGTVGDSILSDGDNIYIILKDSMTKCQLNEKKK